MRKFSAVLALFISIPAFAGTHGSTVTSTIVDGGSVITTLGYDIQVNKGSTLHRSWVVMNDSSAPVQIDGAGINTYYSDSDREYYYHSYGNAKSTVAISGLEIRYLLFDAFGGYIKTLSGTKIADIEVGTDYSLNDFGSWRGWENDISGLLTVVTFVAQVRTTDGKVWHYNEKAIDDELNRIRLQVTLGALSPTKEK